MRYSVPYKDGQQSLETDVSCTVIGNHAPEPGDPRDIIGRAMQNPVGNSQQFSEFARSSKKLLFILCDGTRPTPTASVLEAMHADISAHPDVSFIIATGTHRSPSGAELERIFGRFLGEFRNRIAVHDARDAEALQYQGTTSRGTPVSISRSVLEADGIVTVNSVEPHYFAGFTGGRKSFLPGVAGYESIEKNHSHATEPGSEPTALVGNPVSEDMEEAFGFLSDKRIFTVQTVMLPDGRLHSAFAGGMKEAFALGVESSAGVYCVVVPEKFSIVISAAPPPMDRDLYQSQKALEHGRLVLEKGGIIILVSACREGVGDRGFYDLLAKLESAGDVRNHLGENYRLGNHKAARWLSLCAEASVLSVTGLPEEVLRTVRMRNFSSLQEAADTAVADLMAKGIEPRIGMIPGGSYTVPRAVG